MTCASCVARIEKKLGKLPGVTASVNLATERAAVTIPATMSVDTVIATVEAAGYTARIHPEDKPAPPNDDDARSLLRRLVVCTILTLPVALVSMVPPLQFPYWQWMSLILSAPVAVWGAWPFHRAMALNIRHGTTTMDTLVSLGVIAAWVWSVYALIFTEAGDPAMRMPLEWIPSHASGAAQIYFEVASVLTVLILLGRWLEARATRRSSAAIRALLDLGAKDVTVIRDGAHTRIPIDELTVNDQFLVLPGEKVATDGVVLDGHSAVDESMLTGESVPRDVVPGDQVTGATLNAQGRLIVQATRVGADTQLAQMGRMIEEAQMGKAPVQRLADKVSAVFVPIVIVIALATLIGWFWTGHNSAQAFAAAVSVLVIACPCALGLATPAALMVGTGRGAQLGILIKGPQILESTRTIDTVVLDKTGTLTTGHMSVIDTLPGPGLEPGELLALAAGLEAGSNHPIALAIQHAGADFPSPMTVTGFISHEGLGVEAILKGSDQTLTARIGRMSWVCESATVSPDLRSRAETAQAQGLTVVALAWENQVRGVITVADTLKPTSAQAVKQFRALGLTPWLVTGDNQAVAQAIADQVGITDVVASVMPQDKIRVVSDLRWKGHAVAMVGDGVNDAAALATADLGISMGAGADVAIEASDITLVRDDLLAAVDAVRLSRATLARIKANLAWAFAYNVAAIPLAVLGLLNPMIAGAAMAFSSVFVVQNSLWLNRFAPTEPRTC